MSSLRDLYQEVILDHNKNPRNYRALEHPTRTVDGYNPLCGDHYTIYLRLTDEGIIEDVSFTGAGCAISKASASVMSTLVKGRTKDQAEQLFRGFHELVTKREPDGESGQELGKLLAFSGVWEFPARVKCATLPWHSLIEALSSGETVVSTE